VFTLHFDGSVFDFDKARKEDEYLAELIYYLYGFVFYQAWCPRFASFFWTLTWAEEGSGWPTERFQLTPSTRIRSLPDHIGMNRIYTPEGGARCGPRSAQKKGGPGAAPVSCGLWKSA